MSDKIAAKIQALLRHAQGTDNEAEASVYLSKAQELMEQYQVEASMLDGLVDPVVSVVGVQGAESGHAWRWKLYNAVAILYGCESIRVRVGYRDKDGGVWDGKGKPVAWYEQHAVGRQSAVATTDVMYPWLVEEVRRRAKVVAQITEMSVNGQAKRIAAALISRIHNLVEQRRGEEVDPDSIRGKALMLLDAVKAEFDRLHPKVTLREGRTTVTDTLSRAAANSISLNLQAGADPSLKRLR